MSTTAGDLELAIPKLRSGSFFPSLLKRRHRIDQALFAGVMEAYVTGTSVRKVEGALTTAYVAHRHLLEGDSTDGLAWSLWLPENRRTRASAQVGSIQGDQLPIRHRRS